MTTPAPCVMDVAAAADAAAWAMFDPEVGYAGDYADFASHFAQGAVWMAAGMAVCEFLTDLAWLYSRCRECNGQGYIGGDICTVCCSTGKRDKP